MGRGSKGRSNPGRPVERVEQIELSTTNIGHDHWVYGNKKEISEYRAIREKGVPVQAITIVEDGAPEAEQPVENPDAADDQFLAAPVHDTGSVWYSILSFFLPILGIIAALIFKSKLHYRNYKACKKGALIGFAVIGVILIVFLLLMLKVLV